MNHKKIKYDHKATESKWQRTWEKKGLHKTDLLNAPKPYYNLMMWPYPSAEGLHVGHLFTFSGADIHGRYKRLKGYDVFEPIGFDSGGIHSENFAIKMGVHPNKMIPSNIANFTKQLKRMGNMFDWDHVTDAMDPDYYKWTQWIFIELFKAGLAVKKNSPVTWCPSCKTTVSDEQTETIDGQTTCERCKHPIERKNMSQWFFKITDYAQRLLDNTQKLNWSKKILTTQQNWIGKSQGINIEYDIENHKDKIVCFTTRPDTNFGATFIVLAPENPIISKITKPENKDQVDQYVKKTLNKTELERIAEGREKSGAFTGAYAINNLTGKKMPIWVSDFVLYSVGTGAVVGVPGHDIRDFEFAQKFDIPVIRVVVGSDNDKTEITEAEQVQEEEGKMTNSGFLDDLDIHKATQVIMDHLEEKGWGKRQTHYKLRDWCISRQRYWGPPIPMIYCSVCAAKGKSWFTSDQAKREDGELVKKALKQDLSKDMAGWYPTPEKDLPVLLPDSDDYLPDGSGKSPLARNKDFMETTCPECGAQAEREADVSDTFLDSSWYFLRYPSVAGGVVDTQVSKKNAFDPTLTKKWLPVTQYCGGAEHAVLHLMYSRFLTMALYDIGHIDFEEPFPNFFAHGLIIKDGAKMSKSRGNVVNPDEYIERFGADVMRLYMSFMGPYSEGGDIKDVGVAGMSKFVNRFYNNILTWSKLGILDKSKNQEIESLAHKTIKKVENGIEKFKYNTAIAALMEFMNGMEKIIDNESLVQVEKDSTLHQALNTCLLLISPLAPHISEELWQILNESDNYKSIHSQPWPEFDDKKVIVGDVTIAVQVNGKLRATMDLSLEDSQDKSKAIGLAKDLDKIKQYIDKGEIVKEIFIPQKLVNFVVK